MSSLEKISTLIDSQLPQFIREDHPVFVEFLQKYYEFLEQPGQPVYEIKRFSSNFDVDETRSNLLKYFKNKILPSFPEETELTTEKIIKASREFYAKKGTPESFKFLFKTLYNTDIEVFFPKLQILKASDGKWVQPQAFRLSISNDNLNFDVSKINRRRAYGSISRASCIIESANRTIDPSTNKEIFEVYISNLNRFFQNGEYLEVQYVDDNGVNQTFSEKIIGAISNIKINPTRRGRKYRTGDPVVINGGLDTPSQTKRKAVAVVGNVTTGSIDSLTIIKGGYGFRTFPDSLVDIISANGIGANIIVSSVDTSNAISLSYITDSILYKKDVAINAADYGFDNIALANVNTTIQSAMTFESLSTSPINAVAVINGGSFFDGEPDINVITLYDSDYYLDQGLITVNPGSFNTYNNVTPSITFSGGSFSTVDGFYNGWRIRVEKEFRTITNYVGSTKTATLDRAFEKNVNNLNILTKTLFLDSRPTIEALGILAHIDILNGGTGYSNSDTVVFNGTGSGEATATVTCSSGVITAINITNRGAGFVLPPDVSVVSSGGSGASFKAILMGDGENLDVITTDIGQIKDFVVIDRGSDYVSNPVVSLKVYDLYVSPINESQHILENDIVYQGANSNSTTFYATVDSYDPTTNILRVFNYSGAPSVGQNLVVYQATSGNINLSINTVNVNGTIYPFRYGDGRAKANASFLNGLIKYNGYFLNTDGMLSSDKRLQDADKYHNFSYTITSEVQYKDYSKSITDIAHPAGAKLIPVFQIKDSKVVAFSSNINVHSVILSSNSLTNNVNVGFNVATVTGAAENFLALAQANDMIVINSANVLRQFTKTITDVVSNNSLNIESACVMIGEGRASTNSENAVLTISGNTHQLVEFIDVNDVIMINVSNSVLTKTINSISGNTITMNSNTGIVSSNANLIYQILPKLNVVSYEIIKTTN